MGETPISWCDFTFNLWEGCWKISPGCANCYASEMNTWLQAGQHWGRLAPRRQFKDSHWKKPFAWQKKAAKDGVIRTVFCGSVMDIAEIHEVPGVRQIQHELRRKLFLEIIPFTPNLRWLLLSKRPENFEKILPWYSGPGRVRPYPTPRCRDCADADVDGTCNTAQTPCNPDEPYPNVWLMTTVENQEYADKRLPILRSLRAAGRAVSYEPALGPIDWQAELAKDRYPLPDVVIFGDESGRKRRPAELAWAQSTRDACAAAGVHFHFKQFHGEGVGGDRTKKGTIHLPILDGRQHDGGFR